MDKRAITHKVMKLMKDSKDYWITKTDNKLVIRFFYDEELYNEILKITNERKICLWDSIYEMTIILGKKSLQFSYEHKNRFISSKNWIEDMLVKDFGLSFMSYENIKSKNETSFNEYNKFIREFGNEVF